MVKKTKITARPPVIDLKSKEREFITEGVITEDSSKVLPWKASRVREDMIKFVTLRLDEPTFLKLKYVAERNGKSANSICVSSLKNFLEKELKR